MLFTLLLCYLLGRPFEARGLLPGHGINPSLGPPLATSCCKGFRKKTPYSERACAKLRHRINRAMEQVAGIAAHTTQRPMSVAFHASVWHKPERVIVLLPGPYASGMTHPSLQGCTCSVSWKEHCRANFSRIRPGDTDSIYSAIRIDPGWSCRQCHCLQFQLAEINTEARQLLWIAKSYSSHKSERVPSLVPFDAVQFFYP